MGERRHDEGFDTDRAYPSPASSGPWTRRPWLAPELVLAVVLAVIMVAMPWASACWGKP